MPESRRPLSAVEVLGPVAKSLRRIEADVSLAARVVESCLELVAESRLRAEPCAGKGSEPVAAPEPS